MPCQARRLVYQFVAPHRNAPLTTRHDPSVKDGFIKIIQIAQDEGMQAITPAKAKRKTQRALDTRYLSFVHIAGTMKWLH